MVNINWNEVPDDIGGVLPDGKYLCVVGDVKERLTSNGDEMWNIRLEPIDHEGSFVTDNIVFSHKALKRAKYILKKLGLDLSREGDIIPSMIIGRSVFVEVTKSHYIDSNGDKKPTNRVTYAGYESAGKTSPSTHAPNPAHHPVEPLDEPPF